MTKFGAPLVARASAVGQFGAVVLLAFGVFFACSSDSGDDGTPGGASGHSGGSSSAGKGGKGGGNSSGNSGGDSGSDNGDSGSNNGDSGAAGELETAGGKGGESSAGKGGKGGETSNGQGGMLAIGGTGGQSATAVCGNGKLEPGEACDDGNTVFGDSCSPTCTNICELCEKDVCGPNPEYLNCDEIEGDAAAGPETGTKRSVLCQSLVACYKRTGCAKSANSAITCYCGTATTTECKQPGMANGACSEEMAAAAEDRTFDRIQQRIVSPQYAVGVAGIVLFQCEQLLCGNECVLGKAATECQKCAAIDAETMSACYVGATTGATVCSAAMECAHRTGCALNGLDTCYGGASAPGPCATELTAALPGLTPESIVQRLTDPYSVETVIMELRNERDNCQASCFPSSSGGGSGGGGGTGGTSGGVNGGTAG